MIDEKFLRDFELDIADCYRQGMIRAPIHLRGGCEQQLIEIFEGIGEEDHIYGYWASHLYCLLKGVPPEELKKAILDGKSISLCFPEYRIFCSGIVGSLAGVAVGHALAIKMMGLDEKVFLFTGDMGAETGIFYEAAKYVQFNDLPVVFIVEDNGLSVMTDTKKTWGDDYNFLWLEDYMSDNMFYSYQYKNTFPHSGINQRVSF